MHNVYIYFLLYFHDNVMTNERASSFLHSEYFNVGKDILFSCFFGAFFTIIVRC